MPHSALNVGFACPQAAPLVAERCPKTRTFVPVAAIPSNRLSTRTTGWRQHIANSELLERRTVSILFCDVKGFTTFSERLDPEEITDIMNEAFEVIVAPVNRFGGMVARLMGDGMLAFFGAPHAHEDDPERAVAPAWKSSRKSRSMPGDWRRIGTCAALACASASTPAKWSSAK